ncbi:hypothetical protein [Curvibacter gracilis]|uniref:hypothetical protein n=1 Tax=Curvibacter gracilis TaxID=230310 RepID=UPI0004880496|nr:hypothetical protein [Curvibacter gracilis]
MEIHQLSLQYQREQDRILMRFNTTSREELRLWLTRLLLKGWWPMLLGEVPAPATGDISQASAATPDQAAPPIQAVPAPTPHADYGQPFRADYVTLPLGEVPLLVTEVSQQRRGDKLAISFLERLDPQAPGRTVDIEFEPGLQQGLRQLLTLTLGQTDWNLPDTPLKPPEPPSALNTPPTASRSGYLH